MDELQQVLGQLKDIEEPAPVSLLPYAPGWLIIYALIFILLALLVYFRYNRKGRIKKQARLRLKQIRQHYAQEHDAQQAMQAVNKLLKQVAISLYGRGQVAGLYGRQWALFLNEKGVTNLFQTDKESLFEKALYGRVEDAPVLSFINKAENWLGRL